MIVRIDDLFCAFYSASLKALGSDEHVGSIETKMKVSGIANPSSRPFLSQIEEYRLAKQRHYQFYRSQVNSHEQQSESPHTQRPSSSSSSSSSSYDLCERQQQQRYHNQSLSSYNPAMSMHESRQHQMEFSQSPSNRHHHQEQYESLPGPQDCNNAGISSELEIDPNSLYQEVNSFLHQVHLQRHSSLSSFSSSSQNQVARMDA